MANQWQAVQINPAKTSNPISNSSSKLNSKQNHGAGTVSGLAFFDILQSMFSGNTAKTSGSDNKNYNSSNDRISALKNLSGKKDITSAIPEKMSNVVSDIDKSTAENIKLFSELDKLDKIAKAVVKVVGVEAEEIEKAKQAGNASIQIDNIAKLLQLLGVPIDAVVQIIADFNNIALEQTANAPITLSANNIDAGSITVSLEDTATILTEVANLAGIPEINGQNIANLVSKLENIVSFNINPAATNEAETVAYVEDSIAGAVQTQYLQAIQSGDSAERIITAFLEANNLNAGELQDAKLTVSDETRTQTILDTINSMGMGTGMRSTKINPAAVSTEKIQVPSNNLVRDILLTESSETSAQVQVSGEIEEMQNQNLTQLAANIRQFSVAAVNDAVAESNIFSPNPAPNLGVAINNADNTDEVLDSLSGIINVRGGEAVNNAGTVQQVTELRTHIANAMNEVSELVARNRTGGNFELKIKLVPEALGEILVKVVYNRGNVNLNIVTENRAVEAQLLNQVETLKESLAAHNFNLAEFDVDTKNQFAANYNQAQENAENNRNWQNNLGLSRAGSDNNGDNGDADNTQNVQRLANLYMKRIMYKTI